jgi:hypothetical protein
MMRASIKSKRYEGADVLRTPNRECPACRDDRFHVDEEWKRYHPKAGTGVEHRIAPGK